MLDKLSSYLLYGNLFCGIEHTASGDEDLLYVSLLQKQKQTVDITCSFETRSFDELSSELKKNQHATLVINTENVLTKKIVTSSKKDIELVFSAFPNIDLDTFYYEILNQESSCFISICRKDYVNELISKYSENGVIITDFYLGNLIASSISEFIEQPTFYTSNSVVQKKEGFIDSISEEASPNTLEYDINGLKTNNRFLLSLSGALNQVLNCYNPITNATKAKESLINKFKQLQFFNVFLKFGLGVIFVALLANYFVFNHYFNSVKELQAVSTYNKTTNQKIIALKKDVDSIQKLADDMLQMESSKSSFFISDIMKGLPSSVLLSQLNYQPMSKNIKDEEPIVVSENIILIAGES